MVDVYEIKDFIMQFANIVAAAVEHRNAPKSDELTRREADERFGRRWMNKHIANGSITGRRQGKYKNSPIRFSRFELLALKEAERQGLKMVRKELKSQSN